MDLLYEKIAVSSSGASLQGMVIGNPYFLGGSGPEAMKKLKLDFGLAALDLLSSKMQREATSINVQARDRLNTLFNLKK